MSQVTKKPKLNSNEDEKQPSVKIYFARTDKPVIEKDYKINVKSDGCYQIMIIENFKITLSHKILKFMELNENLFNYKFECNSFLDRSI